MVDQGAGDVCGLFLRINGDNTGGATFQAQVPDKCTKSFGAINSPTGTLSSACYSKLLDIDTVRNNKDIQTTCPVKLKDLPKSQWGDPYTGIGYNAAFDCLMLLQNMGIGSSKYNGADCSANPIGNDSDSDSIPNAIDVDDDGDLIIDTADSTNGTTVGVSECNIEPAKSIRSSINEPLNYGLVGNAKAFDGNRTSATYGFPLSGSDPTAYSADDLNQSINYELSGSNFGISYYVYKPEFFPSAMVDADGSLPAVWVTCPGVVWCDAATSRATVGTGMEMTNATYPLTAAQYDNVTGTMRYTSTAAVNVGSEVTIAGVQSGSVEFNYVNATVASVADDGQSFTIDKPAVYCRYDDESHEIVNSTNECGNTNPVTPTYPDNVVSGSIPSGGGQTATVTLANPYFATGFNKTAFNYSANRPWSSITDWTSNGSNNLCAGPAETIYQQAVQEVNDAQAAKAASNQNNPDWNQLQVNEGIALLHEQMARTQRSFRTPCWSELTAPVVFKANADGNGQCQKVPYDPNSSSALAGLPVPAQASFLWQSRCVVSAAQANNYQMSRIVQGAFISPNINMLDVNTDGDPSNDLAAADALSATDVLTLNYVGADGSATSIATTIGAYPITAPLIRKFNNRDVDYSKIGELLGANRPLGSLSSYMCQWTTETADCLPHAVVVDPAQANPANPNEINDATLTVEFDRPQRESFPGETGSYRDVYGLSYGLELDTGGHIGCGNNFSAKSAKMSGTSIAPSAYKDLLGQFNSNESSDSGAAYLAPLKDSKLTDSASATPADPTKRLQINLDIVKCLRDRSGMLTAHGYNLRDLQLPYGSRTDGLATDWVPRGVGNGDSNCIQIALSARGEGKTGGTDAGLQQFCLQLAPGALTDWSTDSQGKLFYDPANVHAGNYLVPKVAHTNFSESNGTLSATVSIQNFSTFDPEKCEWDVKFEDLDDGESYATLISTTADAMNPGNFTSSSAVVAGHHYATRIAVTGCAPKTLVSNPTEDSNKFIPSAGGNGSGGSGDGGSGGNNNSTVSWGNSYLSGSAQLKSELRGYDPTNYDWIFEIINSSDQLVAASSTTVEPMLGGDGQPNGMHQVMFSGLPTDSSNQYFLKLSYRAKGSSDSIPYTYVQSWNPFTFPFPDGTSCAATSSTGDVCP